MKMEVPPQKVLLARSDEQLEYEISSHDWNHLKYLVTNICAAEPIHLTLGTFFWGISITAFFGALSLPIDLLIRGYPSRLLSWSICGVFFLGGISCAIYAYIQRNNINSTRNGAITYLNHLEKKFGNLDENLDEEQTP